VELLIVMAILGILAGLLAWGVNAARVSILKRAQAFEVQSIASAVEAYRTKYGDYPPDGSSWPVMEAHLRKAFPNILAKELELLDPKYNQYSSQVFPNTIRNFYIRNDNDLTDSHPHLPPPNQGGLNYRGFDPALKSGRVFDGAEALVFFLGGFSNDPQRPFTGAGGPLKTGPNGYIYNTQRENAFFEFKIARLTIGRDGVSTDETDFGQGIINDLMPVYVGAGPSSTQGGRPIVYFDSRTYQFSTTQSSFFNFYTPDNALASFNCARPFLSNEFNTSRPGSPRTMLYQNAKTFQLINAGYDNIYGCRAPKDIGNGLVLFTSPGGQLCKLLPGAVFEEPTIVSGDRFSLPEFGRIRPVDDNTSNFIDAPTFGESN
jgi:type II secretory pathway pseudopilin PulG